MAEPKIKIKIYDKVAKFLQTDGKYCWITCGFRKLINK